MHILVNLAEVAGRTLNEFENNTDLKGKVDPRNSLPVNSFEAGTVGLVRTACKAFTRGADERSGAYRAFTDYVISKGEKNKRVTFKGNRFNVLFVDAGLLHYFSHYKEDFLERVNGTSNGLLKSILHDLKAKKLLAGAKALGLIEKLKTCQYGRIPLWKLQNKLRK